MKGATKYCTNSSYAICISIHAPNEGSDYTVIDYYENLFGISIHAPNEGSDGATTTAQGVADISIHAPNEGSDSAYA